MTALPATSDFNASTATEGQIKTANANLLGFLSGLFGTDGTVATALATLGALGSTYVAKTAAYTVVLDDRGKVIDATTGTWTLSLPSVASAAAGFSIFLRNTGSGTITIDPASTEQVDGATTLAVGPGKAALITCTGSAWITSGMIIADTLKVLDSKFTLQDNGDATKQVQFEVSGVTTGTTRTLTVPNASGTLALAGTTLAAYGITDAAPLASPALTGTPTAPTPAAGNNSTNIATTAFAVALAQSLGLGLAAAATTVTLNSATTSGLYSYASTDANVPLASTSGSVIVARGNSSTTVRQIAICGTTSPAVYVRTSSDGGSSWTGWTAVFTQANAVGTVSQSSGTPTGALLQRIAGKEGRSYLSADGSMRCSREEYVVAPVSTAEGNIYTSATVTWTFPTAFAGVPQVKIGVRDAKCWASIVSVTKTTVTFQVKSSAAVNMAKVSLEANGRWFLTGGAAVASPADLFLAGEKGGWWDISDWSTLWQDTAGTVPVTAVGQSVARVDDKSGNGSHLLQATSTKRPTLQITSDGRPYLSFDGVDDFMSCATMNLTGISKATVCAAGYIDAGSVTRWLCEYGPSVSTTPGFALDFASSLLGVFNHRGASSLIAQSVTEAAARPAAFVVGGVSDLAAPSIYARLNGVSSATSTTATGGGDFGNQTLYVGARAGAAVFLSGRIYEMVIRANAATTSTDYNSLEEYLNMKAGAF